MAGALKLCGFGCGSYRAVDSGGAQQPMEWKVVAGASVRGRSTAGRAGSNPGCYGRTIKAVQRNPAREEGQPARSPCCHRHRRSMGIRSVRSPTPVKRSGTNMAVALV